MKKGQYWMIASVILALISFVLMKVMYVVDPIEGEGGQITALVFVFINFPIWVLSGAGVLYGAFLTIKKEKELEEEPQEVIEQNENGKNIN